MIGLFDDISITLIITRTKDQTSVLDTGPQSITEDVSILELMFSNYQRAFLPLVNEESSSQINIPPPISYRDQRSCVVFTFYLV